MQWSVKVLQKSRTSRRLCVCVCVCVCAWMCVCIYMAGRERDYMELAHIILEA